MPRNKGKKKKGKVVKPNMEESIKAKLLDSLASKNQANLKVTEESKQAAATTDSNSALDAS